MPRGIKKIWYESAPGGVRNDLNPAVIPPGQWRTSSNFLCRRGVGVPRPGTSLLTTVTSADMVMGLYKFDFQYSIDLTLAIQTVSALYVYEEFAYPSPTLTNITGTAATPYIMNVPFAMYDSGGQKYLVRGGYGARLAKYNPYGGAPTTLTNIAAGPSNIISMDIVGPYLLCAGNTDVVWNSPNDIETWPSDNTIRLSTGGFETVYDVKALNNESAAMYSAGSVHILSLQAAKSAFRAQLVSKCEGPCYFNSVVRTHDAHYWMTRNGKIAKFDGSRVSYVANCLELIAPNIGNALIQFISGAYIDATDREVWFFYNGGGGDATSATNGICFNIDTGSVTPHTFAHPMLAAARGAYRDYQRFPEIVVGDTSGRVYEMGSNEVTTDNGTAIPWWFDYGYRAISDNVSERGEVDALTSYWKKTSSSLSVGVGLYVTDSISDNDTFTYGFVNPSSDSNHLTLFRGKRGKWARLIHSASSVIPNLEFRGASLSSWLRSMI